jgi:hypothetical protein
VINNGRRIPLAIQRSLHVAEVKLSCWSETIDFEKQTANDFEEHDRIAWRRYELTLFA